jgi:hypothetical protein
MISAFMMVKMNEKLFINCGPPGESHIFRQIGREAFQLRRASSSKDSTCELNSSEEEAAFIRGVIMELYEAEVK